MESISLLSRKMRLLNELVPALSFSSKATTYLFYLAAFSFTTEKTSCRSKLSKNLPSSTIDLVG